MANRHDFLGMIRAFPGGWDAMAGAMGLSKDALENRIYERKGQTLTVHQAEQMQAFSATTLFAEGVARDAGGVFIKLPVIKDAGNDELLAEFNLLYAEVGDLSEKFHEFTADGNVDADEKIKLDAIVHKLHRTSEELLALTYRVYCKPAQL